VEVLVAPGTLLVTLTVLFVGIIAGFYAIAQNSSSFPSDPVPMLDNSQPQWTFGLGCLALVVMFLFTSLAKGL